MYRWPLNVSNFTFVDRLKIAKFFLTPSKFWTQGSCVKEFERKMATFMGYKYAVFVSSGSTANTILAMNLRDNLADNDRNIVVLPSTTWQTSCSPWIREGFSPHFIDIDLKNNFNMSNSKLFNYVAKNHKKIACIFPTSLLGLCYDYSFLKKIKCSYPEIYVAVDECENNFGVHCSIAISRPNFTCTTSTYFGHQLQSVEGGFIFTDSEKEYHKFLIYRNHGMSRSLQNYDIDTGKYRNKLVDERFDFYSLGGNFRNTDINAFIGLIDFEKADGFISKRKSLSNDFCEKLDSRKFFIPRRVNDEPLFCLPIVSSMGHKSVIDAAKAYCDREGIEYRPIISGYLGFHRPYKKYMRSKSHKNSIHIHNNGIYVGLHTGLSRSDVLNLISFLNHEA